MMQEGGKYISPPPYLSIGNKMPDKKQSVVILRDQIENVAIATLAVKVAVAVDTAHGTGLQNAFLMKKIRAIIWVDDMDVSDAILVGIARGSATITDIKSALENNNVDRNKKQQAAMRDVLFETLTILTAPTGGSDTGQAYHLLEVSVGGGKGIPFDEGEGWQWFAYNMGANNQVAGALLNADVTYWGAWLGN